EEKYRTTLRSTPDTVAISCVEDGRFLELNDGFTRMFGYSREEAIGKTVTELDLYLAHTDRDRLVEALSTQEEANELEFTYRRKDGTLFKGMQSARPIRFGDEDCLISVVKDISSLDTAQKALGESEGKYRSLFEQAGDYILMLEVKDNVINLTARLIIHIILSLVDFVITLKFASWANRLSGGNEDSVYFLDQLHNDIPWSFKKQKQSIFGF
ncbi:MAG: PAS domain S-box protein, partial [Deltaproteobacteria bacterium]|nr:PAS domain S-box protein [Deltaproteobacteria bacterium]